MQTDSVSLAPAATSVKKRRGTNPITCAVCGLIFTVEKSRLWQVKTCSIECRNKHFFPLQKRLLPSDEDLKSVPAGARLIPMTKGLFATVDEADYEFLNQYNWHTSHGYAVRADHSTGKRKLIRMHLCLIEVPKGMKCDHKDLNPRNNRRENLRVATHDQNLWNRGVQKNNTTGFKGVTYCKQTGRWTVNIQHNKKTIWLGRHDTPELAAAAYQEAALKYHGKFTKW